MNTIKNLFQTLDPSVGASVKYDHFLDIYDQLFAPLREQPITLLEIGIEKGGSLDIWSKFFPNGNIIGIDIKEECKKHERDNIRVYIGDQGDKNFLKEVATKEGPFDVIIDDGPHTVEPQIIAFSTLFPFLKREGHYIVEDLHTCYMKEFNGGLHAPHFIDFSRNLIDYTTYKGSEDQDFGRYANTIKSMFYTDKLLVITKGAVASNKVVSPGFEAVGYPQ